MAWSWRQAANDDFASSERDFFDDSSDYATWANDARWEDEERQVHERTGK